MAVATAIAIGAGVSAASSIYAANKGAGAAKSAAAAQQRSASDALNLQRSIYNQQMQMQSPFVGLGQQSAMTLGRLTGITPGSRFAAPPMQAPMGMTSPIGAAGGFMGGVPRMPSGVMPLQQQQIPPQMAQAMGAARPTLGSLSGMRY
jgi:hypothetical protein